LATHAWLASTPSTLMGAPRSSDRKNRAGGLPALCRLSRAPAASSTVSVSDLRRHQRERERERERERQAGRLALRELSDKCLVASHKSREDRRRKLRRQGPADTALRYTQWRTVGDLRHRCNPTWPGQMWSTTERHLQSWFGEERSGKNWLTWGDRPCYQPK
jgi:hypothetical protein